MTLIVLDYYMDFFLELAHRIFQIFCKDGSICKIRGMVLIEVVQRENAALEIKKPQKRHQNLCHRHRCKLKVQNWCKSKMNHSKPFSWAFLHGNE